MIPRPPLTLLNRIVNPIVRTILRSPLHALLSRRLLLLTYTRANGELSTIPVGVRRTGVASVIVDDVVTVAVDLGGRDSVALP